MMQQVVSITSQGQVSLPQAWLRELGIKSPVKAVVRKEGKKITIEPKKNFWSLAGSLQSKITATDEQLEKARENFSSWIAISSPGLNSISQDC